MSIAVPRTLTATRAHVRAELGSVGIPAPHWPRKDGEDCLGFLTTAAGIREPDDFSTSLISIKAFRASSGWEIVRKPDQLRPGHWPLWDWDEDGEPDHIGFLYSLDRVHDEITTDEADTSPKPGQAMTPANRGVYEKTRALSSGELWGALVPPYAPEPKVSSSEKARVRKAATWLNANMPLHYLDPISGRTITLYRTGAGDGSGNGKKGDGERGPLFRTLAQAWGRKVGIYGDGFRIDGIYGPRCEAVVDPALLKAHG